MFRLRVLGRRGISYFHGYDPGQLCDTFIVPLPLSISQTGTSPAAAGQTELHTCVCVDASEKFVGASENRNPSLGHALTSSDGAQMEPVIRALAIAA